jgi:hypothetical protein
MEFTEGLKAAFEQSNCMFRVYADLEIKGHRNTNRDRVWTYSRDMVVIHSLIG